MQFAYTAPNTKIKAMVPTLLQDKDYEELLAKNSIRDIVEYLKKDTSYAEVLKDVSPESIHRGKIESIIKQSQVDDYIKLIHYYSGPAKSLIKLLLVKYEIEDLKILLRGIDSEKDPDKMRAAFIYLGKYSQVDYDELSKSRSIGDLIDSLKDTIYYHILQDAYSQYEENRNLFYMELALDLAYYRMLSKKIKKLSLGDRAVVEESIGLQADLMNIEWVYRCITYYSLNSEEILNYSIDIHYKIPLHTLKELTQAINGYEMEKILSTTYYHKILNGKNLLEFLNGRDIARFKYRFYRSMLQKGKMNLLTPISYFQLREYEVRDLITLIELVRYENPPDVAKEYLIRQQGGK